MPITDFRDRKILVTGAAGGIGRATALALPREGAQVFLTDINAVALDTLAAEIRAGGGIVAVAQALDIADYEAVRGFAGAVHAAHGSLDVIMNIAGISIWGSIEHLEHQHWRRCVEVN